MEWLVGLLVCGLAWIFGRRDGIREGARATLAMEETLINSPSETEREVLRRIFGTPRWHDPHDLAAAARKLGGTYHMILRRQALEDCQTASLSAADREEWQRENGKSMPPLSYSDGYLQAVKDVIAGASDTAHQFFASEVATELARRFDESQREFADPGDFYLDIYRPDGRGLGTEILKGAIAKA